MKQKKIFDQIYHKANQQAGGYTGLTVKYYLIHT